MVADYLKLQYNRDIYFCKVNNTVGTIPRVSLNSRD